MSANDSIVKKIQRKAVNGWVATKTHSLNTKEHAIIKKIEYDIRSRRQQFGLDYLTLKDNESTTSEELQSCLDNALSDIATLKAQIQEHQEKIDMNKLALQQQIEEGSTSGASESTAPPPS